MERCAGNDAEDERDENGQGYGSDSGWPNVRHGPGRLVFRRALRRDECQTQIIRPLLP